jgi:hypothetical protein
MTNGVSFLSNVRNPFPFSFPDEATSRQSDRVADFGAVSPSYFDVLKTPLESEIIGVVGDVRDGGLAAPP